MEQTPTAFTSYSWDSEEHKAWVREFATRLRRDGIDVTIDQWGVQPGDSLTRFMDTSITQNDFVIVICTPTYKEKSMAERGGVAYEGNIISAQLLFGVNSRKFIPVLRDGEWETATPVWLQGRLGFDFRGKNYSETEYQNLLRALMGEDQSAPLLGSNANTFGSEQTREPDLTNELVSKSEGESELEMIKIIHIVTDEITSPSMDGTAGSALYTIPFQLSQNPPARWAEMFVRNWDRPSQHTSRHRPGIARISGNRLYLEGTTIEEVEKYHINTLKLALRKTNEDYKKMIEMEKKQQAIQEEREAEHRRNVTDMAKRINFDDD